jgi:hypothetical protein
MVASKLLLGEESRKLSVILVNKMVGQERLIIFGQQPFVPLLLGHLFFSSYYFLVHTYITLLTGMTGISLKVQ